MIGDLTTDMIATTVGAAGASYGTQAVENCIRPIPWWCGIPFTDLSDACKPYSNVELHQMSVCLAAPLAKVNPDLAAQSIADADAAQVQLQKPENTPASDTC